jgi:hypothetical protein
MNEKELNDILLFFEDKIKKGNGYFEEDDEIHD